MTPLERKAEFFRERILGVPRPSGCPRTRGDASCPGSPRGAVPGQARQNAAPNNSIPQIACRDLTTVGELVWWSWQSLEVGERFPSLHC
jgi:hypothetical protein